MTSQTQMQEKQEIPEFIKGIPTGKLAIAQRREIVEREYNKLLEKLGKKHGKKKHFVHNDFLNVDVEIIKRESFAKASNASVKIIDSNIYKVFSLIFVL